MSRRALDDPELEERRLRALALVHQYGDPVLRAESERVTTFDDSLREEAAFMIRVMTEAQGVGLAAPQVGRLRRLIVASPYADEDPYALCNPEVTERSEEEVVADEGCLSIAEILVPVSRPESVVVEAQDLSGAPVRIEAEGWEARVLQHEIDHVNGVLMLDRTTPEARREALRELRGG